MRKLRTFSLALLLLAGAGHFQEAKGQAAVIDVLGSGISDADKLLNAYFQPFGESFSIGLGQNWYNTAKPLKLLRFNVQTGVSAIMIPTDKQAFNPQALGMQNLRPLSNTAPTVFGSGKGPSYELSVNDPSNPGQRLVIDTIADITQGLGLALNAVPFAQFNIGLIKGTELSVRFVPTIDLSTFGPVNGSFGLWGVGVKHDILQWIPVADKLPFSLSGYFNYSKLSFDLGVNLKGPESKTYDPYTPPVPGSEPPVVGFDYTNAAGNYANQAIAMDASSMGFGIIASKKLLFVTPYVSLGFQNAKFSLRTAGEYAILSGMAVNGISDPQPGALREQYTVFTDPINIEPTAINSFRYGAGLRFKFFIFAIHAEYFGVGGYTGGNVGLSLGF
ncbi:MAG: hypothetical protein Q8J69_09375 [Sphingobacteriaceae bacterium]|nr:hypothetical protein [Sphingobacteriaceae bacterium]